MKSLFVLLLFVGCTAAKSTSRCDDVECGTWADCDALCAQVSQLDCASTWGIDPDDGACLETCQNADPGMCPKFASLQTSCEEIDRATECGK